MALSSKEADIAMLLAAQCHLGTKNLHPACERYVHSRRSDGIHVINVAKTWDKLQLAARIIVAIENPADIAVLSSRPFGQRAALKFAHYTGAKALAGRHTPGTFTNQIQKHFEEPRLLLLTDPRTDHQPIRESAYMNIPTIAFADTDSPLTHVDVAIPANNKGKHSIGVLYYVLARMVLQMRGTVSRGGGNAAWEVPVDLFFYRDPEEVADKEEEAQAADETAEALYGAQGLPAPGGAGIADDAGWDESAPFAAEGGPAPAGEEWGAAAPGAAGAGGEWEAAAAAPAAPAIEYAAPAQFGAQY